MTIVSCDNKACKNNTDGICTLDEIYLMCEYQYEFTCAENTIGE